MILALPKPRRNSDSTTSLSLSATSSAPSGWTISFLVLGDGLGAGKELLHPLGAELVALNERLVVESEFLRGFGSARVITEENHFDAGMEGLPGLQGVALDYAGVAAERLGGGEYGQHIRNVYYGMGRSRLETGATSSRFGMERDPSLPMVVQDRHASWHV